MGRRRLTQEEWAEKVAEAQPGHQWDLSGAPEGVRSQDPWFAVCPEHGPWRVTWNRLQRGHGCPKCASNVPLSRDEWIEKIAKAQPGHQYDFSQAPEDARSQDPWYAACPEHGEWRTTWSLLRRGAGCPRCAGNALLSREDRIKQAEAVHGAGTYDYSLWPEKLSAFTRVTTICEQHGPWEHEVSSHVNRGTGCPSCALEASDSRGVLQVVAWLDAHDISYEREVKFDTCRNSYPLPFDFLVAGTNILIEFDGPQHFQPVELWGGEETFARQQLNDCTKNEWADANGFKLIRIRYDEDIEARLRAEGLGQKDGHG